MTGRPPRLQPEQLRALREGDRSAREAFFEHYYDRVYGYVLNTVRVVELAEDLTHEAFLRMHGALDRLDPECDPSPWVFTVASNVVRDHWRRRHHAGRDTDVDVDDLWEEPTSDGPSPDAALLEQEADQRIQRALQQLSPSDRELILLRTREELSTEQLGEVLGINAAAVRQRWSRAVRRLGAAFRGGAEDARRA